MGRLRGDSSEAAALSAGRPKPRQGECRMQNEECRNGKQSAQAAQSHTGAKAEGRIQNDEGSGKATQSHINATSKPPQSLLIANRLRPQSHPEVEDEG